VARSYESIEGDIAKARDNLAATLDELGERVSPKNIASQGKEQATAFFKNPVVLAAIGGVAALAVGGVLFSVNSKRKRNAAIDRYLESKKLGSILS